MKDEGVYARQSIDKKDSISIEDQIEKGLNLCECRDTARVYRDKGYSGKDTERPDFKQLIQDIKSDIVSKVVVYKIDRISRNLLDFAKIMELFTEHGVNFVSVSESFDTSTPIGRAMLYIIMVFAQLERETIQQRVKDNYYARAAKKFFVGGSTPYGYSKIPTIVDGKKTSTFEVDDEMIGIIDDLYDLYANTSATLGKLSKKYTLNADIERNFSRAAIGRILRNPFYVKADADIFLYLRNKGATMTNEIDEYIGENGVYLYAPHSTREKYSEMTRATATLGLHTGRIDSQEWLKCQYKLDGNKPVANKGGISRKSWLAGLMKCEYCGLNQYITSKSNNTKQRYIICGGRVNHFCYERTVTYRMHEVEDVVGGQLLDHLKSLVYDVMKNNKGNNTNENKVKIKIAKIDDRIKNLMLKLSDAEDVTMDYINATIRELDEEKRELQMEFDASRQKRVDFSANDIDTKKAIESWHTFDMGEKREIALQAIKKIIIGNNNIDIIFY